MTQEFTSKKARIIKASHLLQSKIGSGDIDDGQIRNMQKIMDSTTTDFVPMAIKLLDELAAALANAKARNSDHETLIIAMIEPVMQIKANAAMFHYELVSNLANLILHFLEHIDTLDDDVIDIVDAHHQTLSLIINNKISGMGGNQGEKLEKELQDACRRYYSKKGKDLPASARIADPDPLGE